MPPKRRKMVSKKKRKRSSNPRLRSAPQQQSGLGRMIAKGVQSLLSGVPAVGPVLGGAADFLFKAVGLTNSAVRDSSAVQRVNEVSFSSLQAMFEPCVGSLVSGSSIGHVGITTSGTQVTTQYDEVRLLSLTIEVTPNNPIEKRAGEITLSFQPYFEVREASSSSVFTIVANLSQEAMRRQYLCVSGPANKMLSVTYRPRVSDGWAYGFRPINQPPDGTDDAIGQCCILYRNLARDSYSEFKPSEFHCQVVVSSRLEARSVSGIPVEQVVKRKVIDLQANVHSYVISKGRTYVVSNTREAKVTSNSLNTCDVTGVFQPYPASTDFVMVSA